MIQNTYIYIIYLYYFFTQNPRRSVIYLLVHHPRTDKNQLHISRIRRISWTLVVGNYYGISSEEAALHVQANLCGDFSIDNMIQTVLSHNLVAYLADIPFTFSCVESKSMQKNEDVSYALSDYSKYYDLEKFCDKKEQQVQ